MKAFIQARVVACMALVERLDSQVVEYWVLGRDSCDISNNSELIVLFSLHIQRETKWSHEITSEDVYDDVTERDPRADELV